MSILVHGSYFVEYLLTSLRMGLGAKFSFFGLVGSLGGNFSLLKYSVFAAHCSCVTYETFFHLFANREYFLIFLLQNFSKHSYNMEQNTNSAVTRPHYEHHADMSVDLYTLDEKPEMQLLRGRALLNPDKKEFAFVQNTPRGPRSVEVGRTLHARYVRRPDGGYTATVRFEGDESLLREKLLSEVREMVTMVGEDMKRRKVESGKLKTESGKRKLQ